LTATSAVDKVAARSSTTPERNDRRRVPMVVRRYRSVTSRMVSSWAVPRLKARRVGRPRTTSRKWVSSATSARQFSRERAPAERPMSAMKTGMTGRVTSMISADWRSTTALATSTAGGTVTASTTCGRYRAK
jgi:hypothetical protein